MTEEAEVLHNVLLLRINKLFREGMSTNKLYEVTRGAWKANSKRRDKVEYALAVYKYTVREVYKIKRWHEAGSTQYKHRAEEISRRKAEGRLDRRYEFTGKVADNGIRMQYIDKSVKQYCKGSNPVLYVSV